ncbi:MAG TPA: hypothetical protein VFY29_03115 [Terriglobia bacterium]|nr:hypothetical protein [Terriglobia bacterium]
MTVLAASLSSQNAAQGGKLAVAKGLRCSFPLSSVAGWKKDGQPEAALKPGAFTLRFDSIDTDEGTAKLRNGTMESEIIARAAPGYLHLMQSFRSGPMYITTVFDQPAGGGKLKAVHSRHEYLEPPLAGATSSPEQYYGECEITE